MVADEAEVVERRVEVGKGVGKGEEVGEGEEVGLERKTVQKMP